MDEDIKRTLRSILEYVDADTKYADYAQLKSWLRDLIKRNTSAT